MKTMRDLINFRDLGGYKTKDGRQIPFNTFFRSGSLARLNEEEIEEFKKYNIKYILDLRSKEETNNYPDPIFDGIEYARHSGVQSKGGDEIDFSPTGMRQIGNDGKIQYALLMEYYANMAYDNEAFHVLMDYVSNKKTPIIFHCASGKDRTGMAAILLLFLLGVDEDIVIEDYLLSNEYCKEFIEEELIKSKDLIEQDPHVEKLLRMMMGVRKETAEFFISSIYQKYLTIEDYFMDEFGFDEDKIKEIRDYYLVNF